MSALGSLADNQTAPAFVRYWTKADNSWIWGCGGLSANDPKRTSKTAGKYPLLRSRSTNDLTYWPPELVWLHTAPNAICIFR